MRHPQADEDPAAEPDPAEIEPTDNSSGAPPDPAQVAAVEAEVQEPEEESETRRNDGEAGADA